MARRARFPPTIDQLLKLEMKDLKASGYLDNHHSAPRNWYQGPHLWSSVAITVNLEAASDGWGWMDLAYTFHGQPIQYRVELVQVASNLGRGGGVWYFVCPRSGQRCRTLYWKGGYFVGRQALAGMLYRSQLQSKAEQAFSRPFKPIIRLSKMQAWLSKPNVRRYYRGKPTRLMRAYLKRLAAVETT